MLTGMRSFARSKWAVVLLVLLAAALVFTMGNDPFSGVTGGGFVRAGDRSYAVRDANRILDDYVNRTNQENGGKLTRQEAAAQGVANQVVMLLQQQAAALAYADKIGVRASPSAIADMLANAPRFKDALGRADSRALAAFAQEQGYNDIEEFQAGFQDDLTNNYLIMAVQAGLKVPSILTDPFVAFQSEQRTVAVARLTEQTLPADPKPTEEELKAFYDEKTSLFERPERRRISVLSYSQDDYLDRADITDEKVREEYERRIREFSSPETRVVEQFVAAERKPVQDVVDLVKQGKSLVDAVAATEGVQLTELTVEPSDVADEGLSNIMFGIPPGETYGPVQVKDSWHGVSVKSVKPGVPTPFEQVADKIRNELQRSGAQQLFRQSENDFYDMAGGLSLEEIAEQIGVPVIQTAPIDATGRAQDGMRTTILPRDRDALTILFTGKAGDVTDVVEAEKDGFVDGEQVKIPTRSVYRLDEVVAAYTPAFEDVQDEVRERYLVDWRQKEAARIANEVADAVRAGGDLDAAAKSAKMVVLRPPRALTRAESSGLDPSLAAGIFSGAAGDISVVNDSNGVPAVLQIIAVEPGDPAFQSQVRPQMERQLRQLLGESALEAFQQGIQKDIKVRTNEAAVSRYLESLTATDQ
ncbi:MAG: peptidyl-prolyl cis-trans isomerase [Hyphomonadaceae bacterium]